ncbi:Uncharacterised protein [Comamonas testosteroni]|uniref:Uncharacterized protein n=1 Tax=Comamonas testosteroni TaxID=285 RepID=A0A8B4S6V8_COMTE|nr:hypothetical protein DFO48_1176 [Comamonas sp. AG1104]SUY79229.1 Uncharacterised protein [Comamonas testosteroni]
MNPLQAPMHAFAQRCTNFGLDTLFCTFFNANACNRPQGGNPLSFTRCFKTRNLRTHNRSQIPCDCISRNFCYEKQSNYRLMQKGFNMFYPEN